MKRLSNLLLFFLIAFIGVVLVFNFIIYSYAFGKVKDETINNKVRETNIVSDKFQESMSKIERDANYILSASQVKNFSRGNEEEQDRIQPMIKNFLLSDENISNITLYFPEEKTLITTDTNYKINNFIRKADNTKNAWISGDIGTFYLTNYDFNEEKQVTSYISVQLSQTFFDTINGLTKDNMVSGDQYYFVLDGKINDEVSSKNVYLKNFVQKRISNPMYKTKNFERSWIMANKDSANHFLSIYTFSPIKSLYSAYKKALTLFIIANVFIIVFGALLIKAYYKNIVHDIGSLTMSVKSFQEGNYSVRITKEANPEFRYLFNQFNRMAASIENLIKSIRKEKKYREIAELRELRMQIQPHFLYNSLFYIIACADNPTQVTKMAKHLAEYYRYVTKAQDVVPLTEELKFVDHYLSIQAMRKNISFSIRNFTDEEIMVLPLIIQPIVENSIVHGAENQTETTDISIFCSLIKQDKKKLVVRIQDTGGGVAEEELESLNNRFRHVQELDANSSGIALSNINDRLINMYGSDARLHMFNEGKGLVVIFTITY